MDNNGRQKRGGGYRPMVLFLSSHPAEDCRFRCMDTVPLSHLFLNAAIDEVAYLHAQYRNKGIGKTQSWRLLL